MPLVVQLRTAHSAAWVKKGVAAHLCKDEHMGLLLQQDADVYKPDGEPLVMLRRGSIPKNIIETAYPALHHLRNYTTTNRYVYGGSDERKTVRYADGTKSKTVHTAPTASAIIGYFDRQGGRHPMCRTTRFTSNEVSKWKSTLPMVKHVNNLFKKTLPERYAAQAAVVAKTKPAWVISQTVFTTLTVNNNAVAAVHCDKGDYKKGFGVISCVRRGEYSGACLCFPQYGCAVDLQDGDVLFFNAHEWHGMTPMEKHSEDAERITCVYYFREKMVDCGSPEEELRNAKNVRGKL